MTTIEGILNTTFEELSMYQEARREQHPEVAAQLDGFLKKI